jgi:hypothetical protein
MHQNINRHVAGISPRGAVFSIGALTQPDSNSKAGDSDIKRKHDFQTLARAFLNLAANHDRTYGYHYPGGRGQEMCVQIIIYNPITDSTLTNQSC